MKTTILISTLSLGLFNSIALADEDAPRPPRHKPPVIAALDVDQDGAISEEEMENAAESLAKLDQNNDGELTPEELRPPRPPKQDGGADAQEKPERRRDREENEDGERPRPVPPIIQALDKNGDGTISERELKRAKRSLSRLDQNRDDQLTRHELEPPRPERGGRPGPPPHDGGGRPPRGPGGRR